MKVYALISNTYDGSWGAEIELFGVFSTEEKAKKQADEMKLDYCDICQIEIDEIRNRIYLGGYIE